MKHLHIKTIILILIISLFSCSNDDEKESIATPESIEGIWNATNYSGYLKRDYTVTYYYDSGETKTQKEKYVLDDEEWDKDFKFGRNVWTFKTDKSMTTQNTDIHNTNYEKYLIDIKNSQLLLYKTSSSPIPVTYDIISFTKDKLIISRTWEETYYLPWEYFYDETTKKPLGKKEGDLIDKHHEQIVFERVE